MLAHDLLHFMDSYQIKRAILVGMSMGGTVAINAALTNPERVEGLFVVDMTVGKYSESLIELIKSGMTRVHNFLKQIPPDTDAEQVILTMSEEIQKIIPEGLTGKVKEQMIDSYLGFLKRQKNGHWSSRANIPVLIKALNNPDSLMSDPEGIYSGPSTFIYGTESILDFSTNEARIKQHFPGAKMVAIQGSSHNIIADCPDMLQKTLLEFLSKV
ncbi:protein ABHD11-like [Uloborus diversus]|uniref:protein ABHD11-like n=1 Tax=Uloborus diversus TaxID=327109 RepID=UPI002409BB0A|nr:protein ABHD11-like [Uloborus diversus]